VDRIFTRIGASDRILAGQSTFMVELEETATILHHATVASLVIVDELGRGTSTFDGYAIAYSTLKHIAQTLRCRTIFSTHYHVLGEEMAAECGDLVAPYHMHYALDPATGAVTFLYQLRPGVCPKSYVIDVARKAGLPSWLLDEAQARAADFERQSPLAAFARETQLKTILRRLGDIANGRVPRSELPALQRAAAAYLAHHGPP
jgi:DNA mismatch repair protein MSH6